MKQHLYPHLMIASYAADITKAENLLSVNQVSRTAMPCHICGIGRKYLADFPDASKRCWKKIEADLPKFALIHGATKDQLKHLDVMTVLPVALVLLTAPYVVMR